MIEIQFKPHTAARNVVVVFIHQWFNVSLYQESKWIKNAICNIYNVSSNELMSLCYYDAVCNDLITIGTLTVKEYHLAGFSCIGLRDFDLLCRYMHWQDMMCLYPPSELPKYTSSNQEYRFPLLSIDTKHHHHTKLQKSSSNLPGDGLNAFPLVKASGIPCDASHNR